MQDAFADPEDELVFYTQQSKLLRFRETAWQAHCTGVAELLKSNVSGMVKFRMLADRTGAVRARFFFDDYVLRAEA